MLSNTAMHRTSNWARHGPSFERWKEEIHDEMMQLCSKMRDPSCKIIDVIAHVSKVKARVSLITRKCTDPEFGCPHVEWITPSLRELTAFVNSFASAIGELSSPNHEDPMEVFRALVERDRDFRRHEMMRMWEKVFATASDADNDNIADRLNTILGCGEEKAYCLVISTLLQPKMPDKPVPVVDLLVLPENFSPFVGAHKAQIQHILSEMDEIVQTEWVNNRRIAPEYILRDTLEHFGELGRACLLHFSAHVSLGMVPHEHASANHTHKISQVWQRWRAYEILCANNLHLIFDRPLAVPIEKRTIFRQQMQAIFPLRIHRVKLGFFYGDVSDMFDIIKTNDSYVRESVLANRYDVEHNHQFGFDFLRRNLTFNELCVGPLQR